MVAKAALVFGSEIGATGMYTAVFLVFFQQKWQVADAAIHQFSGHGRATDNLVERAPLAPETVGAQCSVGSAGCGRDVVHVVDIETVEGGRVSIVVEVARKDDLCVRLQQP